MVRTESGASSTGQTQKDGAGTPEQNMERQELLEKLRKEGEPVETKMSTELLKFLESAFSKNYERGFLLFAKDGLVCKAVESTRPNSAKSFGFPGEQTLAVAQAMEREGYEFVGTYHHHLDSDRQIETRINPPKELEHWRLPPGYDPVHLSPDDVGFFTAMGFSGHERDKPEFQKILSQEKYLFLGHRSEKRGFRIKCYTPLLEMPEDHPWRRDEKALRDNGFFLKHYYEGWKGILDHPIEPVPAADGDVEAEKILDKSAVKFRKYESDFSNDVFGAGKLRIFTDLTGISMIELLVNNRVKRYIYKDGKVDWVADIGDGTNTSAGYDGTGSRDNLVEEQKKMEDCFKDEIARIKLLFAKTA